jgi:hypothetical protein
VPTNAESRNGKTGVVPKAAEIVRLLLNEVTPHKLAPPHREPARNIKSPTRPAVYRPPRILQRTQPLVGKPNGTPAVARTTCQPKSRTLDRIQSCVAARDDATSLLMPNDPKARPTDTAQLGPRHPWSMIRRVSMPPTNRPIPNLRHRASFACTLFLKHRQLLPITLMSRNRAFGRTTHGRTSPEPVRNRQVRSSGAGNASIVEATLDECGKEAWAQATDIGLGPNESCWQQEHWDSCAATALAGQLALHT